MITNKSISGEPLVCPYNSAHTMLKGRVQKHLVKCRRTVGTDLKWVSCIYDTTHQVPEPELSYHVDFCPGRVALDKHTFIPETAKDKYPIAEPVVNAVFWEDEDVPAYDPQEHCKNNPILRNAATYTKPAAERREFRVLERQRMQQFVDSKSQQSTSWASAQPRRPVKQSEGVVNRKEFPENDRLDIVQLMEKIKLGKTEVFTPKPTASNAETSNNSEQNGEDLINQYDKLEEPNLYNLPTKDANFKKPMSRGRGRGHGRQQ